MNDTTTGDLRIFSRLFTLIGAALVVVGTFLPFLAVPIFHDDTFLKLTVQGGWIALGLAALSLVCGAVRRFGPLYLSGLAIIGLVIYTIYEVNMRKAGYIADFDKAMQGSPIKGLGISFVKSVDFSHGAACMLAGGLILVCVPLLSRRLTLRRKASLPQQ